MRSLFDNNFMKKKNKIPLGFSVDPETKRKLEAVAKLAGHPHSVSSIINLCISTSLSSIELSIGKAEK